MKLSKKKDYIYEGHVVRLTGRQAQSVTDDGDFIVEALDSEGALHWVGLEEVYELGGFNE